MPTHLAASQLLIQGLGDVLDAAFVQVDIEIRVLRSRRDEGGAGEWYFVGWAGGDPTELVEGLFEWRWMGTHGWA